MKSHRIVFKLKLGINEKMLVICWASFILHPYREMFGHIFTENIQKLQLIASNAQPLCAAEAKPTFPRESAAVHFLFNASPL
jgi:hypothetical protein